MKKVISLIGLLLCVLLAQAQTGKVTVSGVVWDTDLNEAMGQASVQLLHAKDSSFVNGGVTNMEGKFQLPAVKPGQYIIKASFIGYIPQYKAVRLTSSQPKVNIGRLDLSENTTMLEETVIVGYAPPVQMVEDTMAFNASAYKVAEGSVLEDLVRKLPGAEVDEEGKITINGKSVSKILVDGKEFFGNDQEMSMKNIPVEMIEKLKTYERKSDLARITGIDDGEEETVLDLSVKPEMKKGWLTNIDLGGGTKSRYITRGMVSRFIGNNRVTVIGGANNVNERGINGGGWGNRGLFVRKEVGLDFNWGNEKLETNGNVRFRDNKNDNRSIRSSETFLSDRSSFSNSRNLNLSGNRNFDAGFKLEWKPDTLTNLIVEPSFSYGTNESGGQSNSATFESDPYIAGITDPLDIDQLQALVDAGIVTNSDERFSSGNGDSKDADINFQLFRRLSSQGRSITLRGSAGYSDGYSESMSKSRIQYYRDTQDEEGALEALNRYSMTPTSNKDLSAQLVYSEPLFKGAFLQLRYRFQYKYSKSDRSTFNVFAPEGWASFPALPQEVRDPEGVLLEGLEEDEDLSRFSEYTNYIHNLSLNFRLIREKYRLNIGVNYVPQKSEMTYKYQGIDTMVVRNVGNWSPNLDFRYRWSKQKQLRFRYRGSTSQPSMTDLLDIRDDSDPLNITEGNPGLKPSFSHNANLEFSVFTPEKQRNIMLRAEFSATQNSISSKMTYNDETGAKTTRPENINGNWNASLVNHFSTALKNQKFTINNFIFGRYSNQVSYLAQGNESLKNTTTSLRVSENLRFSYRDDLLDVSLNGSVTYSDVNNKLQEDKSMDTYDFSYGGEATLHLPWSIELSTNLRNRSRRGYSSESMNTDELIWNAQVSKSFLKGNKATVSFQVFDILQNQSNVSRNITASMRSDSETNAINSYCMLHFIYRLNTFGPGKGGGGGREGGFRPGGPGRGYGGYGRRGH